MMERKRLEKFKCETTTRAYTLVGQSITANFPDGFPDAAIKLQKQFVERRNEIKNVTDTKVLLSPYMCNAIVATYFACLEVSDSSEVPDGMICFKLPLTKYAKINCTNQSIGEAYGLLFDWMSKNSYKQKYLDHSFPIEIFYLDGNEEEDVEILIPIIDEYRISE